MAHPKGLLMERLKKLGIGQPEFRTANTGPDHQPTFLSDVLVDGEVYGTGQGSTKREAERLAAEEALGYLDRNPLEFDAATEVAGEVAESETAGKSAPARSARGGKGSPKAAADGAAAKAPARATTKAQQARTAAGPTVAPDQAEPDEGPFEGPWPMFDDLLAATLQIANDRIDNRLAGAEARHAVRDFALQLYKELLEDLGDVVEDGAEEGMNGGDDYAGDED